MLARKKVLLVDDSKTALMMERMLLGDTQYELFEARDGLEAVAMAQAENPDIILMDVTMPRLDGIGALKRLREIESTRSIPVILVTTRSEAENVHAGFQNGCREYLTKPIDGIELIAKLREHLGD